MRHFDELLSGAYSTTVTEVLILVREVRVKIGVLSKRVDIRIYFDSKGAEPYVFETSALMKPAGRTVRKESRSAPSEGEALRRALRMLTQDYEDAIRDGFLPDETWLVPADR